MTLHLYFARKFFWTFFAILLLFGILIYLVEIVENMRRLSSTDAGLGTIFSLTLLLVPQALYRILPLIAIVATVTMFISLARSSELVVTRASGRSALRSLIAPLAVALMLGGLAIGVMNPIVAATSRQYEAQFNRYKKGIESTLSVSSEGLWLRQGSASGQTVIRATGANVDGTRLTGVTFIGLDSDGNPTNRIEAVEAELVPGYWFLTDAKEWRFGLNENPERIALRYDRIRIPSELTRDQIRDSFGTPSAVSFWDLPQFISRLDSAGFSALAHQVWFQAQLSLPLTLMAMVFVGAGFTLRHTRMGRTGLMILLAVGAGFALHFARNFSVILAQSGQIPMALGTWGPPIAAICLSIGLLLHLEDG